jgi:uncharacterized protein
MSRIQKAYASRFRARLRQRGEKDPEQQAMRLEEQARKLSLEAGISLTEALARTDQSMVSIRHAEAGGEHGQTEPRRFVCDAALGGLARWLRGAGHEASWASRISDEQLIAAARASAATVLTTDSILIERRLFRDQLVPYLWLPPAFSILDQLATVFREFNLRLKEPRCMSCGGELRRESKETLKDRIPPKTYVWLDEYFVCSNCHKLFWKGTHWERIIARLEAVVVGPQRKFE